MLLGAFSIFPLLKGWMYRQHVASRNNVIRGAAPIQVIQRSEAGWVYNLMALSNDCYGTIRLEMQGAGMELTGRTVYAELYKSLGMVQQDPGGWTPKYFRPNPESTAGVYVGLSTPGYQGNAFPYTSSFAAYLELPATSTQASATIRGVADVIAISNAKLFIASLRRVQDAHSSLYIDPGLLVFTAGLEEGLKQ